MRQDGKVSIFIERKLLENEIENFVENTSKFAKILNENDRNFVRSLSQISFNKNFDGNPSFFLLFRILLTWNANSIAWWIDRFCVCKYSHFTGRVSEKWKGYYQSLIQPTPPNLFSRTIRLIGEDSAIPFLWLCSALKKYLTQSLQR